jgi:hypothetical protein
MAAERRNLPIQQYKPLFKTLKKALHKEDLPKV